MSRSFSLRAALGEALGFAAVGWRTSPVGCALIGGALLLPVVIGERLIPWQSALPLALGQAAAFVAGWTLLLRSALGSEAGRGSLGGDIWRVFLSILLNSLFVCLIVMVLGLILVGVAGATGLAEGDDLTMTTSAAVAQGGWETLVLLALEIASVLLVLTLSARLTAAGPATVARARVVSLQALGWTRGSGLKPAAGLIAALVPSLILAVSALFTPPEAAWIDWVWAGVLALIQAPLLAGYSVGLWRAVRPGESA